MPNPSLPVVSPEALAVLRDIGSHRYRGPDRADVWSPDDVELVEARYVVVAELATSVKLPGDEAPRTRTILLTQLGRDYLNQLYLESECRKAWEEGDDYVRLVHELNRVTGTLDGLEVRLSKKEEQLEVHRPGHKAICLVLHPNRTLAVLRSLETGAGVETAWDAL